MPMNILKCNRILYSLQIVMVFSFFISCSSDKKINQPPSTDLNEFYADSLLNAYLDSPHPIKDNTFKEYDFSSDEMTFEEVGSFFKDNCVSCHYSAGNAPFSLTSYSDIKKRALVIQEVLEQKIMPPWTPNESTETFFNAPTITDSSTARILHWIEEGAINSSKDEDIFYAKQELADTILYVDTILTIPTNDDAYQCYSIKIEGDEDIDIAGFEFISQNPEIAHHAAIFLSTDDKEAACWGCKDLKMKNVRQIGAWWNKGQQPYRLDNGLFYTLPAKSTIIMQVHYAQDSKGRKDKVALGLHYAEKPTRKIAFQTLADLNLDVPENEVVVRTLTHQIEEETNLVGLFPHMHFIARKTECFALTKEGERIDLVSFDEWDYYYQGQYMFNVPKYLPKGSTIYLNAVYDNTPNNPYQPNDPVRAVGFEKSSDGEMLVLCLMTEKWDDKYSDVEIGHVIN